MTDHYEQLGVPRDATPAAIKAAWRRLSSENHPDRGGDPERMAAINRAFEVLGVPEKRKDYDERGHDGSGSQLDNAAEEALRFFFSEAIDKQAEPVAYARRQLLDKDKVMAGYKREAGIARAKLVGQIGKTKSKGARRNLVEAILAKRIAELDTHVLQMDTALLVQARAREFLADYEASETDEQRAERVRQEQMAAQHAAMQNAFGAAYAQAADKQNTQAVGFQRYQFPAA